MHIGSYDVTLDLDQLLRGQQGQDPELEFVCQGSEGRLGHVALHLSLSRQSWFRFTLNQLPQQLGSERSAAAAHQAVCACSSDSSSHTEVRSRVQPLTTSICF